MSDTTRQETEGLVRKHGERHRKLIVDGLSFLDEHEPFWSLDKPIDRQQYIAILVEQAESGTNAG